MRWRWLPSTLGGRCASWGRLGSPCEVSILALGRSPPWRVASERCVLRRCILRRQMEQRPVVLPREGLVQPVPELHRIHGAFLNLRQDDAADHELAAGLGLAFPHRLDRTLACIDALLPQFELSEALLEGGYLIVEFGHRDRLRRLSRARNDTAATRKSAQKIRRSLR